MRAITRMPSRNGTLFGACALCLSSSFLAACGSSKTEEGVGVARLPATTAVFINEIHYDNTGTDAGEAIEIAGPAGRISRGYSLVLYNGNGGAVYDTDVLSGVIPNQDDGFGTIALSYPSNGIQNGSPDGIALVRPDAHGRPVPELRRAPSPPSAGPRTACSASTSASPRTAPSRSVSRCSSRARARRYEDFTWSAGVRRVLRPRQRRAGFLEQRRRPARRGEHGAGRTAPPTSTPNANVSVTFSEPVSVTRRLVRDRVQRRAVRTPRRVSGGPTSYVLDPDADFASGETCSVTIVSPRAFPTSTALPDSLEADVTFSFTRRGAVRLRRRRRRRSTPFRAPAPRARSPAARSPSKAWSSAISRAARAVSAVSSSRKRAADADADPLTSEGIFVFEGGTPSSVAAGDVVRVSGYA